MNAEFALFTVDRCIERGFTTEAAAAGRLAELEASGEVTQTGDSPVTAELMCPDHDEEPAAACTHCFADKVLSAALALIALNQEDSQ